MKGLKKRITLIAAALTSAFVISAASVPAMADTTEQYVTVEDGVTVVYITTYTDADPMIGEQVVTWYDANGTKYVNTIKPRRQDKQDISTKVTWKDAAGNTYVRDDVAKTVTVYDVDGNVTAVMPVN
jgi:hypothetical protein